MILPWLNILTCLLCCLTIILTILIVIISVKLLKRTLNISLLLVMNTSVTLSIYSIIFLQTLLIPSESLTFWCKLRSGYLVSTCSLAICLSYVLQAVYRLYRIVFTINNHTHHRFLFLHYWLFLIVAQWLLALILCLPFLLVNQFIAYIPFSESYCVVTYRNIIASIYGSFTIYVIPVSIIASLYGYIFLFVRRSQRGTTLDRQRQNQRDLTVIKRIMFTVNGLIFAGLPAIVLWILYLISGNLIEPLIYQVTWLSILVCIILENLLLIYFTTEIRHVIMKHMAGQGRVNPAPTPVVNIALRKTGVVVPVVPMPTTHS